MRDDSKSASLSRPNHLVIACACFECSASSSLISPDPTIEFNQESSAVNCLAPSGADPISSAIAGPANGCHPIDHHCGNNGGGRRSGILARRIGNGADGLLRFAQGGLERSGCIEVSRYVPRNPRKATIARPPRPL